MVTTSSTVSLTTKSLPLGARSLAESHIGKPVAKDVVRSDLIDVGRQTKHAEGA